MPKLLIRISAFCVLLGAAAGLDAVTGPASPMLFYLAAVAAITTQSGANYGMCAVLVSVVARYILTPEETGLSALVMWNGFTRFVLLSGVVAFFQWQMESNGKGDPWEPTH